MHFSVLELLRIEELGQSLTGVAPRFLGGDPPETGIDDVLAGLSGEGTAEGAVENIRGRIVGARDDDVVKDKGQQRHQGREHQGGDHHPPGLHTDAAQGGQFATARQTAEGQQGGHQRRHGERQHQEPRHAQGQDLASSPERQASLSHLADQLKDDTHGEGNRRKGSDAKEQRPQHLGKQPAIQEGKAAPVALEFLGLAAQGLSPGRGDRHSLKSSPR